MNKPRKHFCWCCDRAIRPSEAEKLFAQDAYFECLDCYLALNAVLVPLRLQETITRKKEIESQEKKGAHLRRSSEIGNRQGRL